MNHKFYNSLMRFKKTALLLVTLISASTYAQQGSEESSGLGKLQQKLEKVSDYYQQVDDKLNSKGINRKKSTQDNYIQPNSRRDPFAYTEQMYRNQQRQIPQQGQNKLASNALLLAASTAFTADGLPVMKYRGFAEAPSGEVIGILEILGMGTYTVRIGDKIGLHDIVKELVLVVEGLSRNNIIIKTGKLGQKLVIQ